MEITADYARKIEALVGVLEQLQVRNEQLAAESKRIRLLLVALCLFGGAALLFNALPAKEARAALQPAAKIVRANAFIIVDRGGTERGSFGYNDAEQAAYLNLKSDKSGRIRPGRKITSSFCAAW
ncbi:MAG TPA: hypothetical protein VHC22_18435 [Pirellulales bacterium]|nr:hypothetical protein [Pirellulales bacterium]